MPDEGSGGFPRLRERYVDAVPRNGRAASTFFWSSVNLRSPRVRERTGTGESHPQRTPVKRTETKQANLQTALKCVVEA
jgi:hypothetical protein